MRAAAAVLSLCLCACTSVGLAGTRVHTRRGPAHDRPIVRVAALPATCGSLASMDFDRPGEEQSRAAECPSLQVEGVDAAVRSALDFRGYRVVDSETINATTLARIEVEERQRAGEHEHMHRRIELRGTRFADATPAMQNAILHDLNAEGLLVTRIWVRAGRGMSARRTVEVMVSLFHLQSGEQAWASRCEVEAGLELNEAPIMEAARCAVRGAPEL